MRAAIVAHMATDYEKTGIGRRLATYRRQAGFKNAQTLADHLREISPATQITRSTIVNLELGRKRDATIGEVMQLSKALDVPPAALLFDLDNPLDPYDDSTVGDITNVEALRLIGIDGIRDWDQSDTYPHFLKLEDTYQVLDLMKQIRGLALKWVRAANINDESLRLPALIRISMEVVEEEYQGLIDELVEAAWDAGITDTLDYGTPNIPKELGTLPTKEDVLNEFATLFLEKEGREEELGALVKASLDRLRPLSDE